MALSPAPQPKSQLIALIERFDGPYAVLRNEALGEVRWPVSSLPADAKIGDSVNVKVSTSKHEEAEQFSNMRRLLEELIN